MTQGRKSLSVLVAGPNFDYYSLLKTFSYSEISATLAGPNFDHYFLLKTFFLTVWLFGTPLSEAIWGHSRSP
jgi:hypothetical protein